MIAFSLRIFPIATGTTPVPPSGTHLGLGATVTCTVTSWDHHVAHPGIWRMRMQQVGYAHASLVRFTGAVLGSVCGLRLPSRPSYPNRPI